MSNTQLIIEERSRDIGDFLVGRLLPFRKKRMVGPFIFIDHMGPTELDEKTNMDVDQHPHIGLATLTYLLSGEVVHADSIGTKQVIKPGDVNLMIAGSGVTHTERTPEHLRGKSYTMEGYQIWLALPKSMEQMKPEFHHLGEADLPKWTQNGVKYKLIAGSFLGRRSSLKTWSDYFLVELHVENDAEIDLSEKLNGEVGILINKGVVNACSEEVHSGNLLVTKSSDNCKFKAQAGSRIFLLGGESFEEARYIDWNFVASDKTIIDKAISDWKGKAFPQVPEDETYIPYPTR